MTSFIEFYKKAIHENAEKKGFWEEPVNIPEKLMLTVSELSEAMEALRTLHFTDKKKLEEAYENIIVASCSREGETFWKPFFELNIKNTFEDEMIDALIRIFDICYYNNIDIERHLQLKHWYNTIRPYKHGKQF